MRSVTLLSRLMLVALMYLSGAAVGETLVSTSAAKAAPTGTEVVGFSSPAGQQAEASADQGAGGLVLHGMLWNQSRLMLPRSIANVWNATA